MPVAVLPQYAVGPAAGGLRNPGPKAVDACIGIREIAEPAAADRPVGYTGGHGEDVVNGDGFQRRGDDRRRDEPLADQRGGRRQTAPPPPSGGGAPPRRGAAQNAEPPDPHPPSEPQRQRLNAPR